MKKLFVVFPNQLFENIDIFKSYDRIYLVEEHLFFKQYLFHKQKIAFHRASMKFYAEFLVSKGVEVSYVESHDNHSDVRELLNQLIHQGFNIFHFYEPIDFWLKRRIEGSVGDAAIHFFDSPLFLNTENDLQPFFRLDKKKFFQTTFYKQQRIKKDILMNGHLPMGGKWTFDAENRKKYPANTIPPQVLFPNSNKYHKEAEHYCSNHFENNLGELTSTQLYPNTFDEGKAWFNQFLERRFIGFGTYEDALLKDQVYLHHSVLSPMLNTGLLTPDYVLRETLHFIEKNNVPINDAEGFIRQLIGWREFIRGVYTVAGVRERKLNFWNFKRKIPLSFYDGTTGIQPLDDCIKSLLKTGYNHHIERLMVIGNFMLLCEFNPNEVYQWFMEMYIDSYDWVMVPNVYGMSQFADGGIMSTKPYVSGSNYLIKMSNFKRGPWQEIWDGLFWRFIHRQREFFLSNPRMGMLVRTMDKMKEEKRNNHFSIAEAFLSSL